MEGGKKIAAAVVLLIIIVGAVAFVVKRSDIGGPKMPEWLLEEPREKIDRDTGELTTLKLREWRKLGHKEGKYKSPKTGKYSMVSPMICGSCGAKIAPPEFPRMEGGPEGAEMDPSREDEIRRNFMCPKCGKPAFAEEPRLR